MNSAAQVWSLVLSYLKDTLPEPAINTWFEDITPLELTESRLIVSVSTDLRHNILTTRYTNQVEDILFNLFGERLAFEVIMESQVAERLLREPGSISPYRDMLDYSFDSFIVGSSNQFAFNAAKAVATQPGKSYNPLFIYGKSGLGKTHLLYSIANRIRASYSDLRICYVKGDQFTNELIQSIGQNTTAQFRERYRQCDLLLVDDVQFIAGMDRTQVEFFHTFNSLYEDNKQIVLTADRPPNEMKHLEERLSTRFQQGLLADIKAPDYETRMAIIHKKAHSVGLNLPDSVAEFIAANITSNVRQLEGTIKKILAFQELMDSKLDIDTVICAVRDLIREKDEFEPTPDEIIEETAKFYALDPREIKGKSRVKEINIARQVSIYMIRQKTTLSLNDIGEVFHRDHSTVLHAIQKITKMVEDKTDISEIVKDISSNIDARKDITT